MVALVLASASPRRAELLKQLGVSFEQSPVDLDESQLAGEEARTSATLRWRLNHSRPRLHPGTPAEHAGCG